ncbi:hypothetical protein BDV95DRAFT_482944 [Massariosphaeria phaeospora]|uniref:Uncharacterized protein n=1 Tax=Massariosphaeria phaeospora TaxID=100035 RepID=A0A7C8IG68_9PLEO|nr:hypothetical protein BDV95DRAFT_482944 [Massariosphaeria phaeospora]
MGTPTNPTFRRSYSSNSKREILRFFVRGVSDSDSGSATSLSTPAQTLSVPSEAVTPTLNSKSKSKSKPLDLLTELSTTQSLAARLRRDRDSWRAEALAREHALTAAEHCIQSQDKKLDRLTTLNISLDDHLQDAVKTGKQLFASFKRVAAVRDKLAGQLDEAMRSIARLKKSDRAKGKVVQRNLLLKAHMKAHVCGGSGEDTETTLLEALAAATERIEELENAGERLVDALEASASEDEGEEQGGAGIAGAVVAFQGVLEDQTFSESKANWEHLLEE